MISGSFRLFIISANCVSLKSTKALLRYDPNLSSLAKSDSIKDALDYKAISTRIKQYALENHFELIETLGDKVAELILNEFDVSWVKLTISKPHAIRDSKNVSLMIERSKG